MIYQYHLIVCDGFHCGKQLDSDRDMPLEEFQSNIENGVPTNFEVHEGRCDFHHTYIALYITKIALLVKGTNLSKFWHSKLDERNTVKIIFNRTKWPFRVYSLSKRRATQRFSRKWESSIFELSKCDIVILYKEYLQYFVINRRLSLIKSWFNINVQNVYGQLDEHFVKQYYLSFAVSTYFIK